MTTNNFQDKSTPERNGASHRFFMADVDFVTPAASAVPLTCQCVAMRQGMVA